MVRTDLDADEEDDPVLVTLLEDQRVKRAYHEVLAAAPRPLPRP